MSILNGTFKFNKMKVKITVTQLTKSMSSALIWTIVSKLLNSQSLKKKILAGLPWFQKQSVTKIPLLSPGTLHGSRSAM